MGALQQLLLSYAGAHRASLHQQVVLVAQLEALASRVRAAADAKDRAACVRAGAATIVVPAGLQLPISPRLRVGALLPAQCAVMNSKKLPLWLVFERVCDAGASGGGAPAPTAAAAAAVTTVLFKAGDDLRQDQLILQTLGVMEALWKAESLDLRLSVYRVVSTGAYVRVRACARVCLCVCVRVLLVMIATFVGAARTESAWLRTTETTD
jgi:phosphatidylinositol-4,5-bisphosphate 3-kinase